MCQLDGCRMGRLSIEGLLPTLKLTVPIPIERGCESKVSCPTTQLNAPGQV